ncbi:MAG: DUF4860 domain-containing protein [Oscillospiraceae bacterium]|nr:DUF4860 domain-containing protein [Oscillospiraceae bacterium]
MREEKRSALGLYTVGIAALFLAGFLLLVVFGAKSYRKTVSGQSGNMQSRALLSYLSTTVKACDERGAVLLREDAAAGPVLVLKDGNSGYALRIYCMNGQLLEDYAEEAEALRPEHAQVIGETDIFEPVLPGDGTLSVRTDSGSVFLCLRGEEGAG